MEWWIALIVVAALGIAAAAAVGGMGEMAKEPVRDIYRQQLPARPLHAGDLSGVRFGVTLRGYAMDQVDDLLDRLAADLAERDALITELSGSDPVELLQRRRHQPTLPESTATPQDEPEPSPLTPASPEPAHPDALPAEVQSPPATTGPVSGSAPGPADRLQPDRHPGD